jgi:hypothetical protein
VLVAISAVLTWFLVVRPALRSWSDTPVAGTGATGDDSPAPNRDTELIAP